MTAALIAPADLSEFEFDIPCEICDEPALVGQKGCADPEPVTLCRDCYMENRRWFYDQDAAWCSFCYRPFLHYETHFDIINL